MVEVRKENVYGGLLFVFSVNTFVLYRPRFGNFLQPKVRLRHDMFLLWIDVIYGFFTPSGSFWIFHTHLNCANTFILSFSDVQQKRYKELLQHHNQHLTEQTPLHRLMDDSASPFEAPGFLGMFGRFAVIGDRLSPFVSGACMIMACLGWRHRVEGWHALGFVRSWRPIL